MGINYESLVRQFRKDPGLKTAAAREGRGRPLAEDAVRQSDAARGLADAFAKRHLRPHEFDFGKLFAECFGYDTFVQCRGRKQLANEVFEQRVTEAEGAVSTAAFQNISGQIVYATLLEKYQSEEFQFAKLIPERPAIILDGEKIAGITEIGDQGLKRKEGDPYTYAGVGEDWIYTPPVPDYGMIVPVTWEAVFNDRTGQVLDRAGDAGYWIGYGEEVRAVDCLIDENTTDHRYNWRGTVIASYNDNTGTHTWDNLAATNGLVDWTNLNTAEQVFNGMVNPYTGTPILIEPRDLIVYKGLEQTANRIVHATEIRVATPGYATTGNPTQTVMANPYLNKYTVRSSRLLAARLATDTSWFLGDVTKYAVRMVAEPLQVVTAPTGIKDEFERRIIHQWRANKRYAHSVVQPRAMVKSTA